MRKLRIVVLGAAGTLLVATAAVAATDKMHCMKVGLPDGSVAHIQYVGDVAPKITVEPVTAESVDYRPANGRPLVMMNPFADFERISAMMERQSQAMMRHVAELQRQAESGVAPGQVMVSSNLPAGSYSYSVVSSTTQNGNCVQTVEWRSDGSSQEPKMTRASSGDCDGAKMNQPVVQAAASQPQPKASDGKTI